MEITPEIKDENLRDLLDGGLIYNGEDRNIAAILYSDGYANLTATKDGDVCTITPKGKSFLAQGGYTAIEKEKERRHKEAETAKEIEKQNRLQEIEIQRIISLELMKKEHEFQEKQNQANRKNSLIAALISAVISVIVTLITQAL